MSSGSPDAVQTQNGSEESQQDHSHPEAESVEAEPPPYIGAEPNSSSAQGEMDPKLSTEHAQQQPQHRPSTASVPSLTVIIEGSSYDELPAPEGSPYNGRAHTAGQNGIDAQLPTEHAHQPAQHRPSSAQPPMEHTRRLTTERRRSLSQLPSEYVRQPSERRFSTSSASSPRAVVVGGKIVWTESSELGPNDRNSRTGTQLNPVHEEVDQDKVYPDRQTEVISEIITSLYDEAQCSDPDDEYNTPCCEVCPDLLCQKINCKNLFKTEDGNKLLLTDTLRRGRAKGWKMLLKIIFPLLPDTFRDLWVIGEIFTAVIGLLLSIVTVAVRPKEPFGIVHLVLATLFSVLVFIDGVFTLKDCTTCKKCYNIYKGNYHGSSEREPYLKCCSKSCLKWSKNISDVVRVLASEILLYPLVVCDIFKVITGGRFDEGRPHADRLGIALLVLTSVSLILYVYIARIFMLVRVMKKVLAMRSPNYKLLTNYYQLHQNYHDFSIRRSAFWYQAYLLLHTILQMIVQLLILIAIGFKTFQLEAMDRSTHEDSYVFLWYMIVMGFITPTVGLLTSILVTYRWIQEFPIGLCLDIINIWKMGGADDFVHVKDVLGSDRQGSKVTNAIHRFLKIEELRAGFKTLHETNWCKKFVYPFTVPAVAIACLIYLGMQAILVIYAIVILVQNESNIDQFLGDGGWVHLYIIAIVVFTVIVNAYSIGVASFWLIVAFGSIFMVLGTGCNLSLIVFLLVAYLVYKLCKTSTTSTSTTNDSIHIGHY